MKRAETDAQLSLQSDEFVWNEGGLTHAHRYLQPVITKWLRQSDAKAVLDLGCGNGALTNELARQGFTMTGLDASESGISIARKNYPGVEFARAEMDTPLPDNLRGRFDAVIAVEVVEHLLLPRSLLERAKEALRKDGAFIVTTPYHGFLKNLALAVTNKFDTHWHPLRDYGHVKFFSRETLSQLFSEQDLKVERFARVGRIPALAKSMILQGSARG